MKNKTLLIIGLVWPEPKSSAAGTRMIQLIELFQKQGFTIVFASAAQESEFSFDLGSLGVTSQKIELNSASFDLFVAGLNPKIVLFDRYVTEEQFGWRVLENCPDSLRILDTEDLHCLRSARRNAIKKNKEFQLQDLLTEEVAKREIASILRCDLTLIISEAEMTILTEIFRIDASLAYYLPLFYEVTEADLPKYEERNDFVFIGNFLHEPNWDAVKQLKETVWPFIRKQLPEASIMVYGAYPSQKVLQLHQPKEGFFIKGRAANSEEVIKKAKVLVAPLRFGAGLKGKLLEAMQLGTPSVSTAIGAEGIEEKHNWNGFIEDDFIALASKAVILYQDEIIWKQSQQKGYATLQNRFRKIVHAGLFSEKISSLLPDLEEHRKRNFMGSLLLHHTSLSTKYMARWIEEKNK